MLILISNKLKPLLMGGIAKRQLGLKQRSQRQGNVTNARNTQMSAAQAIDIDVRHCGLWARAWMYPKNYNLVILMGSLKMSDVLERIFNQRLHG